MKGTCVLLTKYRIGPLFKEHAVLNLQETSLYLKRVIFNQNVSKIYFLGQKSAFPRTDDLIIKSIRVYSSLPVSYSLEFFCQSAVEASYLSYVSAVCSQHLYHL